MKKVSIEFSSEELEDLWSSLSFFIRKYPGGKKENPLTMKAMEKLVKKVRKNLKRLR